MKIQHLAVIFVIIIIPISFVMSQYLQNQIDTIKLQTAYTANLNTATSDALKAFQINSINNKYSSISDSKIRDIEASINTFYNSLGTSMDLYTSSREQLSTFIPAILFNLYDGYYIYSSYKNIYPTTEELKNLEENSKQLELKDDENRYQDGLRPYIYYSCKYNLNGKIIIVNYTLDNAITVYGDFGNGYETKSGYLINPEYVEDINEGEKTLTYNGVKIGPEVLMEHLLTIEEDENGEVKTVEGDYHYIVYKNKKVYRETKILADGQEQVKYFWYDNYKKTYLQSEMTNFSKYLNDNGGKFESISAFEYYKNAKEFSEWVNKKLGSITQSDVIKFEEGTEKIGNDVEYLSVNVGANKKIFDTTSAENDPMLSSSIFNNHRMAVIRKSIETNLTTAIANYNLQAGSNYEFVLPIIDEENWYKITNNVSIASFMQGIPIGQKYFNNYSVVTNTNNEEVINEQSIYVLTQEIIDGKDYYEYHQPGCKELIDRVNDNEIRIIGVYTDLSFFRQTVKISESDIRYFYPQARSRVIDGSGIVQHVPTTTGCYNCIVNASGDYDIDSIIAGEVKNYLPPYNTIYNKAKLEKVRKAYLTGLARERYDLYKSNFSLNIK